MASDSEITAKELLAIINERDRSYNQRFEAQDKANAFALGSAKEAVTKAELSAEKRFDAVNEFRGQLKDQASQFVTRNEIDIRFKALEDKIALVERGTNRSEGSTDGTRWLWGTLLGVAALVVALIALRGGAH